MHTIGSATLLEGGGVEAADEASAEKADAMGCHGRHLRDLGSRSGWRATSVVGGMPTTIASESGGLYPWPPIGMCLNLSEVSVSEIEIPVRYYKDYPGGYDYGYEQLSLPLEQSTFLLVDVDGTAPNATTQEFIAPALAAARQAKMRVAYVHNDLRLVADPGNIVGEFWGKTKYADDSNVLDYWRDLGDDYRPQYLEEVTPGPGEPNFPKWIWSGFHDTFLDQHLRSWGTRTLFVVGYSRRACLHYTCAEAVGRNYRVILLRDCSNPPGTIEFPDTLDESLPEGGWINRITLRNFEHLIGYTTTAQEFIDASGNLK